MVISRGNKKSGREAAAIEVAPHSYLKSTIAREIREFKRNLCAEHRGAGLAVGWGVEGDVDDGFEFDGSTLFGGGAELPLAEGVHGVGVELAVNAADELDAIHRAVAADYGVEDDFALDMLVY